jgi:predicted regulator of Ras-like GTPase activity (Roadblock/LC7/MglB family)
VESEYDRLLKKVENFPSASAYNRLAELARLNGNLPSAEQICVRCIKEFPRNGQAYVTLAEICLASSRKDDALTHLKNAVDRDPRSYSGHRMLADIYEESKDGVNALRHLRLILTFKPNDQAVATKVDQLAKLHPGATALSMSGAHAILGTPSKPVLEALPKTSSGFKQQPSQEGSLLALCAEQGVRGAVIADSQGRVVFSKGLPDGQADILAAITADVSSCGLAVLKLVGQEQLASWTIDAENGQVMAFQRNGGLTLAIVANPGVRGALLELRARQALIDIGAG